MDLYKQFFDQANSGWQNRNDIKIKFDFYDEEKHETMYPYFRGDMVTVDNNDTVSYGCIRVALELQPSVRKMQPP